MLKRRVSNLYMKLEILCVYTEVKDEKIVKDEEVDDIEKQKAENKALEAAEAAKNAAPAVAVE